MSVRTEKTSADKGKRNCQQVPKKKPSEDTGKRNCPQVKEGKPFSMYNRVIEINCQ